MDAVKYSEFARLDLRVARVSAAEPIPGRSRIMRATIDLGGEERQVVVGGAEHYSPADMVGRTVVAVANLEPREVAGVPSGAMLLAADDGGRPLWLTVDGGAPPGSPVR